MTSPLPTPVGIALVESCDPAVGADAKPVNLSSWTKLPGKADANGFAVAVEGTSATLKNSGEWSYLRNDEKHGSTLLNATITIEKP